MVRRLAALALLAAVTVTVAPATAVASPAQVVSPGCAQDFPEYTRPAVARGTRTLADREIRMSDGAILRADVHLPAGLPGPFPVALTVTGYGKSTTAFGAGSSLTRRGYAVVIVDDRGTGASGGRWDSWGPRTQADYPELLDWIDAQPWSDGRVGVTGTSYMGITSLFVAASGHPTVKSVFAVVPMADGYRDIVFGGGQTNTAFIPLWMGLVTGLSLMPSGDPTTIVEHLLAVPDFQLPSLADAALGGASAFDGPFWRQRSPIEVIEDVDVPTFIVGGLDDIFQRGEPMLYDALADHTDARLLIGPWTHIAAGTGLPRDGVPPVYDDLLLQWFDQHVLGLDAGTECIPPVTQFVRGAEEYRSAPSWPVPDLHAERWYLRGAGGLTPEAPTGSEATRTYLQLPLNGLCSRSTTQWLIGVLDATPCATDNSLDELTALTWTSASFADDVEINGPIQADVWLRPLLGSEALVSVAVSDVAPDGTSRGLTNGLLQLSHRAVDPEQAMVLDGQSIRPWHPFTATAQRPVTPGEPVLAPVEVFPTSAVLRAGHRLRVTIAAYDVPHALPAVPAGLATLGGPVEVLNDPAHPSSVVLPVVGARSATDGSAVPGDPSAGPGSPLPATGGTQSTGLALLLALVAYVLGVAVRRYTGLLHPERR